MTYDRADWHYGGEFPADLPPEAGGTHIGIFLAWIILNNLESNFLREECTEALNAVRNREMTGCQFLFEELDEKFWSMDLSEEGNLFASYYYGEPGDNKSRYIEDYQRILVKKLPSTYHVPDTWESYDTIAPTISERYKNIKAFESKKPWWKLW